MTASERKLIDGSIWSEFCDELKALGPLVMRPELPADPFNRALAFRCLTQLLRAGLEAQSEAAERFHCEARLATQVKHPRVATLHDYSRLPDGSFYMVWEFIEGQDVESWLREKGVFG